MDQVAQALGGANVTDEVLQKGIGRFAASVSREITRSRMSAGVDDPSTKMKIITLGRADICAQLLNTSDTKNETQVTPLKLSIGKAVVTLDPGQSHNLPVSAFANAVGSARRVADRARFEQVNLRAG